MVVGAGWRLGAESWRLGAEICGWGLAAIWGVRTRALFLRLGTLPDLSAVGWDLGPTRAPELLVVVPAKDEAETVGPAMETLLAQDYGPLRIVAVDDRSTDATGTLLDAMAARAPDRLEVVHVTEPADGWMGKTFALAVGTERRRESEYILFTDADVWFSPSILRRAVAYAEMARADHLVVSPTPATKTWGERTVLGFLQLVALWIAPPWRVADPGARWNAVGAGPFNLVRREALEEIGGWDPQRLAVVEDVTLGRRMRAAGMRQRVAFARGMVLVHWAPGASGLIRGMTKNFFALANFRAFLLLGAMFGLAALFLLPLLGIGWGPTLLPGIFVLACIAVWYREAGALSGIPARYGWLYPLGAAALLWAMLRSMLVTTWRRGVLWRGTFYPLRELRAQNSPFIWEWEASVQRAERRRAERHARSPAWLRVARRATRRQARPAGPHRPVPPVGSRRNDAPHTHPE